MLRFVPAGDFNGAPTALTVRGLDSSYSGSFTSGATRQNVDTTINGGFTAIAGTTADVLTNIDPINDAPVLSGIESSALNFNENDLRNGIEYVS